MNPLLLKARMQCPQPRRNFIRRVSLFEKLNMMQERLLTVIRGGAGSGKTTLLASYIKESGLSNVRWLSLDHSADQPLVFWSYALEALSDILGSSRETYLNYFHANVKENNLKDLLIPLLNAISEQEEVWMVLDDFHLIHNQMLLDSIEFFLQNTTDALHLILLTRETPQLYLAKYEMEGLLLLITEQDLLLSDCESRDFLRNTLNLPFSEELLEKLAARADGWIGGLQLMAASLSGKRESDIPDTFLSDRLLSDYLTKEIFDEISKQEQTFLIYQAPMTYIQKAVSMALFPELSFEQTMEKLLAKNLLIQCIDEQQGIYRCHNLMSEFFLAHFLRLDETLQRQIHRKAAAVFLQAGDHEQALHHLYSSGDYQALMETLLQLPQNQATASYIVKIPLETAAEHYEFFMQKFFYHYSNFDLDACEEIYKWIEPQIGRDPKYDFFCNTPVLFRSEAISFDFTDNTVEETERYFKYPLTKAMIYTKNAAFLHYMDRLEEAITYTELSMELSRNYPSSFIYYFALTAQIQIHEEIGQFQKALNLHQNTMNLLEQHPFLHSFYTTQYITVLGIYLKQMNLEAAEHALEMSKSNAREVSERLILSHQVNLGEYLYLTGAAEEAGQIVDQLLLHDFFAPLIPCARLLLHYWQNGQMSVGLQEQYMKNCADTASYLPYTVRLLWVYLLDSNGRPAEARSMVDEVLADARRQKRGLKAAESILLKLYLLKQGDRDSRLITDLYKEAIYYASDDNIRQPFWFERETVRWLIREYGTDITAGMSEKEKSFHLEILRLCSMSEHSLLSERELEVLTAMADGLTNKAIGEELCISLATVKTHVLNIYRKLEVNSRLTAVETGKKLGILN